MVQNYNLSAFIPLEANCTDKVIVPYVSSLAGTLVPGDAGGLFPGDGVYILLNYVYPFALSWCIDRVLNNVSVRSNRSSEIR